MQPEHLAGADSDKGLKHTEHQSQSPKQYGNPGTPTDELPRSKECEHCQEKPKHNGIETDVKINNRGVRDAKKKNNPCDRETSESKASAKEGFLT